MRPLLPPLVCIGLLVKTAMPSASAATAVLYDAAPGTLPSAQGFTFLTDPLFTAKARQSFANATALLDSTATRSDKAGWFSNLPPFPKHPKQPPLDADAGFLLSFVARVNAESHASDDRAGFSVIVTASNLAAIELGFWTGEVWAQSGADFHHAEGATIDTMAQAVRYDLEIQGTRYQLMADGAAILQGDLRRYDTFGTPYNIPEFLFLGDDTTSAQGATELSRVTMGPLPRLTVARHGDILALSVEAESGRNVEFQGSTDLATWSSVGTAPAVGGIATLEVATTPNLAARFFRAALP